jgi:glutamate racemase
MQAQGPIGVFDSGYGGLTVLKEIVNVLPQYHYIYLGDNARAPYGNRSFDTVHQYTWQCVQWFFAQSCPLVILACNTASAKALRTIQQHDLKGVYEHNRVLGVIRPTSEVAGNYSKTKHIGVLGTKGTVQSESYLIELKKFFPDVEVHQQACPMWVPLVENNEYTSDDADFFVKESIDALMQQSSEIDTILLACTHYPLLMDKIKKQVDPSTNIISQGAIVADSLKDYLTRHAEMESRCSKGSGIEFFTTDDTEDFDTHAAIFFGKEIKSKHVHMQ